MSILLDIDEVLADLISGINKLYNAKNGTSFSREDYHSYNWWEVWNCEYEYADRLCQEFVKGIGHEEMSPISGSVSGVEKLKMRHRLVIATSRNLEYEEITQRWLESHYGLESFSEVYVLNHYEGGTIKKSEVAIKEEAIFAVDDSTRHAIDYSQAGVRCLLLDCPWNKNDDLPDLVKRVYSWADILEEAKTIGAGNK
jgi:uncharacterized HAD superfamily protein